MEQTTNLNLKKPATTDPVKISDINGNMDILDSNIKSLQDEAAEAEKIVTTISSKVTAIADYVTENGTTNGWTWRKWNSGLAECWYNYSYSLPAAKASNEEIYFTYNLPFTFKTRDPAQLGRQNNAWMINPPYELSVQMDKVNPVCWAQTSISAGTKISFVMYVKGTWK